MYVIICKNAHVLFITRIYCHIQIINLLIIINVSSPGDIDHLILVSAKWVKFLIYLLAINPIP